MRLTVADIERLNKEVHGSEIRALQRQQSRQSDSTVDREFDRIMQREIREIRRMMRGDRDAW